MLEANAHESIEALMKRLRPFVARRLPSPADVDDVLQEVFLRLHRNLDTLRDGDRFGPWLYRIVRNTIADRLRAHSREAGPPGEAELGEAPEPDDDASAELARCVSPLVARLPSPYREAVTLVDLEGLPFAEAARMAGLSVPGMKSRVQRGRARLRRLFEQCCRLELDVRHRVVDYACRPGRDPRGGCSSC